MQDSGESIIEDDEVYSNDIYAILKTYGVEMAREAILREVGGVFGTYKIQVDRRHLELIADYMVRCGCVWTGYSKLTCDFCRRLKEDTSRSTARVFLQILRLC